jgi:hypothetical protein
MQQTFRLKTLIPKDGKLFIKGLPFLPGETVEVTVRGQKKRGSVVKYPLRGKPVLYHEPFKGIAENDWEALQ